MPLTNETIKTLRRLMNTASSYQRALRIVNRKIELKEDSSINVKLIKPMKIDISNGWIIE